RIRTTRRPGACPTATTTRTIDKPRRHALQRADDPRAGELRTIARPVSARRPGPAVPRPSPVIAPVAAPDRARQPANLLSVARVNSRPPCKSLKPLRKLADRIEHNPGILSECAG